MIQSANLALRMVNKKGTAPQERLTNPLVSNLGRESVTKRRHNSTGILLNAPTTSNKVASQAKPARAFISTKKTKATTKGRHGENLFLPQFSHNAGGDPTQSVLRVKAEK